MNPNFDFPKLAGTEPLVMLTGAGISKESGLHTFRDPDGIWARYSIEEVATPQAFARNPGLVHDFYNARRRGLLDPEVQPNAAHLALARLEAEWAGPVLVVTQNIDDLHERAGSRALIHMHGELLRARCAACGANRPWRDDLGVAIACPDCGRTGGLRPDVVWFGEMPLAMERLEAALASCLLFAAIGTSGAVWPAAGFVETARRAGAVTLELTLEPSEVSNRFDLVEHGPATRTVPAWVDRLLAAR